MPETGHNTCFTPMCVSHSELPTHLSTMVYASDFRHYIAGADIFAGETTLPSDADPAAYPHDPDLKT